MDLQHARPTIILLFCIYERTRLPVLSCCALSSLCPEMSPKLKHPLSRMRCFCSKTLSQNHRKYPINQVTKTNFSDSLEEIQKRISSSDFIAVFLQNTGSFSSPWHRVSPFDTSDTAYLKAKYAAERFQILQFAICPFKLQASKVIAYPLVFYHHYCYYDVYVYI